MKYLALDNALATTGWSVWEDEELLHYGTFSTKSSAQLEQRLGQFWNELNILHNIHEFEYLFLEDCQKQANELTYKRLCMVQATILLWCYFNEIKYTVLSPSHWRKILTDKYKIKFGRSRADQKAAARSFVKEHFSLSLGEDICDSISLGKAGFIEYNKNRSAF